MEHYGTGEGIAQAASGYGHQKTRAKMTYRSGDQGSCWGHQCTETSLTEEPGSIVSVVAYLGRKPLPPRREANG